MTSFVQSSSSSYSSQVDTPLERDNLEDLRRQLTFQLAVLLIAIAQAMILFYEPPSAFPWNMLIFWAALSLLGLLVLRLTGRRPRAARHVLSLGAVTMLIAGMWLFPATWLPLAGVVVVFMCGALMTAGDLVAALAMGVAAVLAGATGYRLYDVTAVLVMLGFALIVSFLIGRTLYTTLDLVWHMNRRAAELLEITRVQQSELRTAVKSLRIVNDIRERTGRELLAAQKHLREAQRAKERFAANISHELRTPLSIILGFSEVMYLSPEVYGTDGLPPKLLRDVYQIYRNSRHLLELIDDILDLSRFEMVGFTLHKELTSLHELMDGVVPAVADLFAAREGVRLEVDLPADLPPVDVDRIRIRQVILNLLSNASRYTEAGVVRVTAEAVADSVVVRVSDTGIGIAPELLDNIFTEFYQVDHSLSRQYGGAGLGLTISKRFVEAHNGSIWAESEPGTGSTFSFSLPATPDYRGLPQFEASRRLEPPDLHERPTILLFEPDPQVQSMVQRHLSGYNVLPAAGRDELADLLAQFHPLALVCNVQPGEQMDAVVAASVDVPVIECSLPSQTWLADALGATACLTKPVNFTQLQHELEKLPAVVDVLVVDDNPGVCQLIERGLSTLCETAAVRMAYDGRAALTAMEQQPPDLLILDLMMPEPDGFGVLATMRADARLASVPVILLTATSYFEDRLAQYGNQVRVYHGRPWHTGETLRCLRGILDGLTPVPLEDQPPEKLLALAREAV